MPTTSAPAVARSATAVRFECKAADDGARTIRGLAAAWSLDQGGDVIHKGAFARTLDHWRAAKKSRPIPLLDSHDAFSSVTTVLGMMTDAAETDDGLEATFAFVPDDATADAAYKRTKGGYVTGLSIGYEAVPSGTEIKDGIRHLKEIKLLEVSLVVFPMNDDARVVGVKHVAAIEAALRAGTLTGEQKARLRALLDTKAAAFAKGDRVEATADHMDGMSGSTGVIAIVRDGPYYGVRFDGERAVHKWLAHDELKAAPADAEDGDDRSGGGMDGMNHGKTARALLDAPPAGTPERDSPAPDAKGLAPDDPQRLALDALLRDVELARLVA